MRYDCIIVGGGIAGLTSAAYLAKANKKVILFEKEPKVGGLVNSFNFKGFTVDGGIRSIENSGIVFPMVKELDLDVEFVKSVVSVGYKDDVMRITGKESVDEYEKLLIKQFPNNADDIKKIVKDIKRIMKYMDILYGIDNPLFVDMKKNKSFLFKTVLPWMFKFLFTMNKVQRLNTPVEEYLLDFTDNEALIDMIAQHFFKNTPASFAMSYFSLYLDYNYPIGGTGALIEAIEKYVLEHNGIIQTKTLITSLDKENQTVTDSEGNIYEYDQLIWAADNKMLYDVSDSPVEASKVKKLRGGDSVLSAYYTLDIDPEYFKEKCTGHFFYTPKLKGIKHLLKELKTLDFTSKKRVINWVTEYMDLTTYEISIPVLRDPNLAPEGKTAIIVSTLMDYDLVKAVYDEGWYDEFKKLTEELIFEAMVNSMFPEMEGQVTGQFSATPLTIERYTLNTDGAITGWAFTNEFMPSENRLLQVAQASITPFKNIYQAGQWSYSPSGLPISILTGKLAANKVLKKKSVK